MNRFLRDSPRFHLLETARQIANEVAAVHATDVDAKSRFPIEAFDALRSAKLLSVAVPADLGGGGANMKELAAICTILAQGCGATGMIFAMHIIQVACIARHGLSAPFFSAYLKALVEKQFLIASITSEVGVWGDTRSSLCALVKDGDGRFALDKDATTVSYGGTADDLLVTCRRSPEAPGGDQLLVLLKKGDYTLTQTTSWDTLGMRGTCSPGFKLASSGPNEQILPGSFADASAETMVSYSHILWSAVWLGIASDAVARASGYVRGEARKKPGTVPASGIRLAEVATALQTFRNSVSAQAAEFDVISESGRHEELLTIGWALKMNHIKVGSSEAAPRIVHDALQVIGISGYKNDSKFSIGRNYRDALSAALMISNDRILAKNASMLLVFKDE